MADLRSAGTGATVAGGHPTQLVDRGFYRPFPLVENSTDPQRFVVDRQAEGSDYLKVFIDDGGVVGFPHPSLRLDQVKALVDAAHRRGMLAVAHVATCADVVTEANAGVDVLGHVPTDNPLRDQVVDQIAALSIAVIPTLGVNRAVCGCGDGPQVAADPHLQPYLHQTSVMMLTMMGGNFPIGSAAKLRPTQTLPRPRSARCMNAASRCSQVATPEPLESLTAPRSMTSCASWSRPDSPRATPWPRRPQTQPASSSCPTAAASL